MAITSVTKDGGYLVIVEDGVTTRRSIVYEDTVCSAPITGYERVGVIYVNHSAGTLVVQYNGQTIEVAGDLIGTEIVTLLEALDAGSRLSHTKLDDITKAANATLGHVIVETGSLIDVDGDGKLTLGAHASTHQTGDGDEISLTGLAGTDTVLTTPKINEAVQMTATATELNILDDATLTTAELNLLDLSAQSVIAGEVLVGTGAGTAAWQKTGVKLSAPDISGIVTAASALTMPAFTVDGNISLGGNALLTTQGRIEDYAGGIIHIRNNADNSDISLRMQYLYLTGAFISLEAPTSTILASNSDNSVLHFQGKTNSSGMTTVATIQAAATNPTFDLVYGRLTGALACNGQSILNANLLQLDEIATPSALADHAQIYSKTDDKFYFQDGAGNEHEMAKLTDVRTIVTGTYTGNNGDTRQIATGMKCSMVIIIGTAAQAGNQWTLIPNACVSHNTTPRHDNDVDRTHLHATDGFVVDKDGPIGVIASNDDTVVYYYWAISE